MAFTAISFQGTGLLFDYRFNKSAFEKNCINKNRPQLKCQGKCQLMKKMLEREQQEQDHPESKPDAQTILFIAFSDSNMVNISEKGIHSTFPPYTSPHLSDNPTDIFHPPRC
jgi:hypothetical protein